MKNIKPIQTTMLEDYMEVQDILKNIYIHCDSHVFSTDQQCGPVWTMYSSIWWRSTQHVKVCLPLVVKSDALKSFTFYVDKKGALKYII